MNQAIDRTKVALEPFHIDQYVAAVESSGAKVSPITDDVGALIWLDYGQPEVLAKVLDANPQIEWVQLPFAGVDAFSEILSRKVRFTSAKGSYAEPVAEHAMALALALGRIIPERARAQTWGRKFANSFYDSKILIVGGGGITEELLKFLSPYHAEITVVRKHPGTTLQGCHEVPFTALDEYLPQADLVFLACALTSETTQLFNRRRFQAMKDTAVIVNVARGGVIDTDALVAALNSAEIAGAAVDVTDPEPLPDGHPLWSADNVLITPHTADTKDQVIRLFSLRIAENVLAYQGKGQWVGQVDPNLGY